MSRRDPARRVHRPAHRRRIAPPGFSLVELSVVVVVIVILASLATVAVARALSGSRRSAEQFLLSSLKQGVEQFRQDFGFLPPLVNDRDDDGPQFPGTNPIYQDASGLVRPRVRDAAFLRSERRPDEARYSEYSLAYYLIGVLDAPDQHPTAPAPIDGVNGPGFTRPEPDGSFSKRGPTYGPYVDAGVRKRLVVEDAVQGRYKVVDRWYVPGQNPAWPGIRYYRWLPRTDSAGRVTEYLVPRTVGDPNADASLRGAAFAIVSLGPDGRTQDDGTAARRDLRPLPKTPPGTPSAETDATPIDPAYTRDNLVEVGQ